MASTKTNGDAAVAKPALNLFDFTAEELQTEITYYDILNLPEFCTADDIKKAYRKTSLKYHPDKTGRESDDYVFLAVKNAYDTLFDPTKRQAYDSTEMPFDDSIPPSREKLLESNLLYADEDFYDLYGPVFRRNLRYDARLRPELNKGTKKKRKEKPQSPPSLGDDSTPVEEVQKFYEYWIHFESWRDFSQTAAEELQVDIETAESRLERRYLDKEIQKRAKALKRNEMQRIQTLVERAMESDPRMRRHRQFLVDQKEKAIAERKAAAEQQAAEQKAEEERQAEIEAKKKEAAQAQKALMRIERRRLRDSMSFEESTHYADAYEMKQHIDHLCMSLDLETLTKFNESLEEITGNLPRLQKLKDKAMGADENYDNSQAAVTTTTTTTNGTSQHPRQEQKTLLPWGKDELACLAKAAKKFPAGSGATRWDQITATVNNLWQNDRSREECIDQYNAMTRNGNKKGTNETTATATTPEVSSDWTPEQDKKLQEALAQFPATMEKNERWAAIAKAVAGKTKKDCVQRFKAIREALLKKG